MEKITEKSSLYDNLDQMSVQELLVNMNNEDKKVAIAVEKVIPQMEPLVENIVKRVKQGGRIFYLGAGTSGRLGVLDASEIPPTYGMPPTTVIGLVAGGDTALRNAVENAEDDELQGWKDILPFKPTAQDTVIGIAASGTTPYVIGAIKEARAMGCLTGCITCNPDSPLGAASEYPMEVIVGPEFVTGSSRMKAGTATKLILNMISTSVMIKIGRVKGNRMVNMQLTNKKLIERGTKMLVDLLHLDYEEAKRVLLLHGSVEKALSSFQ
ncbi:MAG: N-acetylmuramic acid 6-phosphate etherase [Prevotella sp.]|jgi:N-acetylmuramic acid 6-phosphate etherase|nr:N-acetylmuramic acid 6-phosphate etherase [Prevotella sp.]